MVKVEDLEGIMFYNLSNDYRDTYYYRVGKVKKNKCKLYVIEDGYWKLEDENYPINIILNNININKNWIVTGYFREWLPSYQRLKKLFYDY